MNARFTRAAVVAEARRWIGTPYLHQASLRGIGCDCLGLVRGVWRQLVGDEPEAPGAYSPDWAEAGQAERLLGAAARHLILLEAGAAGPGDVVLFRWRSGLPAKHAAILGGAATMIHAHDGAAVCEVAFAPWWQRHAAHAFSFPGAGN